MVLALSKTRPVMMILPVGSPEIVMFVRAPVSDTVESLADQELKKNQWMTRSHCAVSPIVAGAFCGFNTLNVRSCHILGSYLVVECRI